MRTVSCPFCGKAYDIEYDHFFGKICKCGFDIPPDEDIDLVKKNKIKNEELKQIAIGSVKAKYSFLKSMNREVQR